MERPNLLVLAAISGGAFLLHCRGTEEATLSKFFDAVRTGDHVTLSGMSVVGFSGPVESWKVVAIERERRQPFRLPELRRLAAEAEEERQAQFREYSRFRGENLADLTRVRNRLDKEPDYRFPGRWGEIQTEWEKFRDRYEELDRRRQRILREMDEEVMLAKMSLLSSERLDGLDGEVVEREVLVTVATQEDDEHPYRFALRKYDLVNEESEFRPPSRWIITGIEEGQLK